MLVEIWTQVFAFSQNSPRLDETTSARRSAICAHKLDGDAGICAHKAVVLCAQCRGVEVPRLSR